eukprot:3321234-Prymnesium_polylepis.2
MLRAGRLAPHGDAEPAELAKECMAKEGEACVGVGVRSRVVSVAILPQPPPPPARLTGLLAMKRTHDKMTSRASDMVVLRAGGVEFRSSRDTLEQGGRGYFSALLRHQASMSVDVGGIMLPVYEVDREP